jgi:DNA-directed RNA polymerase specialized sigma24 family protein
MRALTTRVSGDEESTDAIADALRAAGEAVEKGEPWAAVEALWRSPVLDGVIRRVSGRWSWLPEDDVNRAVAEAFEALHAAIQGGTRVRDPVHWLSRVASNRAAQIMRDTAREAPSDPSKLGDDTPESDPAMILATEERRRRAVAHARRLLPRLGQTNVQAVMQIVIDAVEREIPSLPMAEIAQALDQSEQSVKVWYSRGFQRLKREAAKEGLTAEDFKLEETDDEEDD